MANEYQLNYTGQEIDEKLDQIGNKLDKENPTGTGSLSMNRLEGSIVGRSSTTIGKDNIASGDYSHAEGYNTTTSGDEAHAEGSATIASGLGSHAEGIALGVDTKYTTTSEIESGKTTTFTYDNTRTSDEAVVIPDDLNIGDLILIRYIIDNGNWYTDTRKIQRIDTSTKTITVYPAVKTINSEHTTISSGAYILKAQQTTASARGAHAEGQGAQATGIASHAEGSDTLASGYTAHAEGQFTVASGVDAHAEGQLTQATGAHAHAEGYNTLASGGRSHAEGQNTEATAMASHAEGDGCVASGVNSHAEGYKTNATGKSSHSEGSGTTASGAYSHAEGSDSFATKDYAHAEGYGTQANGRFSHAEGYRTIATADYQHVQGKNTDTTVDGYNNFVHVVGWGTTSAPKNIHTIDTSGNAWFAGKVTVANTTPSANGDLISKKYADSTYATKTALTTLQNSLTPVIITTEPTSDDFDDLANGQILYYVEEI